MFGFDSSTGCLLLSGSNLDASLTPQSKAALPDTAPTVRHHPTAPEISDNPTARQHRQHLQAYTHPHRPTAPTAYRHPPTLHHPTATPSERKTRDRATPQTPHGGPSGRPWPMRAACARITRCQICQGPSFCLVTCPALPTLYTPVTYVVAGPGERCAASAGPLKRGRGRERIWRFMRSPPLPADFDESACCLPSQRFAGGACCRCFTGWARGPRCGAARWSSRGRSAA